MSTQAEREAWAGMFGLRTRTTPFGETHCMVNGYWQHPPDFAALDGPYFGAAYLELITSDHVPSYDRKDGLHDWFYAGQRVSRDTDLGICTMNALLAKREREGV